MLRVVAYCHSNGIIHRDIKPDNILLNENGRLILADFGLARSNIPIYLHLPNVIEPMYTQEVITLWYRAPELLLGADKYGYEIDNWSIGCVIAEMITLEPIFQGTDRKSQLKAIFEVLGKPTNDIWPGVEKLDFYKKISTQYESTIEEKPYNTPLIRGLLTYNPKTRVTAYEALNTKYFDDIRETIEIELPAPKIYQPKCEEILLLRSDQLSKMSTIDPVERSDILEKMYNFLPTRTFFLALHIFDKYLSLDTTNDNYELIGFAAAKLASDYNDINPVSLEDLTEIMPHSDQFAEIHSRNDFTRFNDLKKKIWIAIKYNFVISLPYDFGYLYLLSAKHIYPTYYQLFESTLFTILSSPGWLVPYTLEEKNIANASPQDLALSCILAIYKQNEEEEEPVGCFKISTYHQILADNIIKTY